MAFAAAAAAAAVLAVAPPPAVPAFPTVSSPPPPLATQPPPPPPVPPPGVAGSAAARQIAAVDVKTVSVFNRRLVFRMQCTPGRGVPAGRRAHGVLSIFGGALHGQRTARRFQCENTGRGRVWLRPGSRYVNAVRALLRGNRKQVRFWLQATVKTGHGASIQHGATWYGYTRIYLDHAPAAAHLSAGLYWRGPQALCQRSGTGNAGIVEITMPEAGLPTSQNGDVIWWRSWLYIYETATGRGGWYPNAPTDNPDGWESYTPQYIGTDPYGTIYNPNNAVVTVELSLGPRPFWARGQHWTVWGQYVYVFPALQIYTRGVNDWNYVSVTDAQPAEIHVDPNWCLFS